MVEVQFIFVPFVIVAKTILLPVIFGGVLFYLTEPLQRLLEKKIPRWGSILAILLGMAIIVTLIVVVLAPKVTEQINNLVDNMPVFADKLNEWRLVAVDKFNAMPDQMTQALEKGLKAIESSAGTISESVVQFIQTISSAVVSLVLAPFFFIFMLKDHEKFSSWVYGWFTGGLRKWMKQTLSDVDQTLRAYIQGQLIISAILATLLFIGYIIIGLEYALLLAVFALLMNVIPFLGPWIAFIPAAIVALLQDPSMLLWVSVITLVAQQADSHLITPNIMGKSLDVHPLTVITLLLTAGNLAGFLGVLLAIPAYAVLKVIIRNIYQRGETIRKTVTEEVEH